MSLRRASRLALPLGRFLAVALGLVALAQLGLLWRRSSGSVSRVPVTVEIGDTLPLKFGELVEESAEPDSRHATSRCAILIFFRSTCPWCERYAGDWERTDVAVLGDLWLPVFWIGSASDDSAQAWLDRHGFHNASIIPESDWRDVGVTGVPEFYLVDRDGTLLARGHGKRQVVDSTLSQGRIAYGKSCAATE